MLGLVFEQPFAVFEQVYRGFGAEVITCWFFTRVAVRDKMLLDILLMVDIIDSRAVRQGIIQ